MSTKTRSIVKTFCDLEAWQESHLLVLSVYQATRTFPVDERFGIASQLRRAASSMTANIAEGFARLHFKDKARFYYQARGSAAEVQIFFVRARDLGYLDGNLNESLIEQANTSGRLINGMIRAMEKQ
jgi:four helix bundle protein